jgi:RHS repeat-associated protein
MSMRFRCAIASCALVMSAFSTDALGAAGRTLGHFSMSATGSAQYSIPLWAPPGIRGIQPALALTYDSHLGYGFMGPGWTLSGLSAIARCNPTYAQDGVPGSILLSTADGLCLDGNRLRSTGTGVYQTEVANFSQVTASGTAGNGPSYFSVKGKDGLTYEYGNTTDSKILPTGSSTPYIWALDKVTDRSGNYMTLTYYQSGGAYVPLSIQYAAPSGSTSFPYKITFGYSTKSAADTLSAAVANWEIQQTNQLSTITVTNAGTTVREYKLLYTTSSATLRATLTSVQECGGSAGTDCLAATAVGYQNGVAGVVSPATATGSGPTAVPTGQYANGIGTADFNGDGILDLFYTSTAGYVYVQFGTKGGGYQAPVSTGTICSTCTGTGPPFAVGDFLGAGHPQIILNYDGLLFFSQWNPATTSFSITQFHTPLTLYEPYVVADVDGDGLDDLVSISDVGALQPTLTVWHNTTTSGSATPSFAFLSSATLTAGSPPWNIYGKYSFPNSSVRHLDFNGDGRDDIIITSITSRPPTTYYNAAPMVSTGTGYAQAYSVSSPNAAITVMPVNWNDDNCTDLYAAHYIWVSGCGTGYYLSQQIGAGLIPDPWMALDWDGDGRTDLIIPVGTTFEVWKSTGAGDIPGIATGITVAGSPLSWIVTDENGDGLSDLAFANPAASNALYYGLHNGGGVHPDLATSFVDGYGLAFSPSYLPLTQATYSVSSATFPQATYVGPLSVIASAKVSDGVGGTYTLTNAYDGGMANLQGRGFGGFQDIKTTDSRTGITEFKGYYPIFPFTGMTTLDWFSNSTNLHNIRIVDNVLTELVLNETPADYRVYPFVPSSTVTSYELGGPEDGQLISTTATNYGIPDNYGNFGTVTTTVTDNDASSPFFNDTWTSTTVNTVSPDTSTWCLNVPTETTVTNSSSAPNGTAITRTMSFTPDYTYCRETQQITEPNSATYKVTEAYGYDTFGNLHTDTVTGIGMTPRVTTVTWNSTGQFPQTIQNALGQSISLGFDPKTGMRTSQTDPNYTSSNPLTTTWGYDDFARQTSEIRPDGTSMTIAYNLCGASCVNSNNEMTATRTVLNVGGSTQSIQNIYLDWFERPLVTSSLMLNGAYDRNEVQYDNLGRVQKKGAPCTFVSCVNYWTTNMYDDLNRLTQSQRPISATNSTLQTTKIQYAGRTMTVTDPQGKNTIRVNLVTGGLARTQDDNGYNINFNYDAYGSLLSVKDSLANTLNTMTYDYGLRAFQRSSNDTDLGARAYTYDALGELTAYSDAKGQKFASVFDALSRPTSRTEPDLTTTWNWGASAASFNIGKLQSVTAASTPGTYSEVYAYDSKTRPSTETITIPGDAAYTYTSTYNVTTGLLDTLQYPLSTSGYQLKLQYTYQNAILQQVSDAATGTHYWTASTANPRGQLTKETLGNGVVVNRALDAVTGWVSSIQAGVGGGASLQNNSYLFDEMGNLTQRQDNNLGLTENVYPDNLYRLDHTVGDSNTQMAYDGMGRILSWTAYGKATVTNNFTTQQTGCTYYANPQLHAVRSSTAASQPAQSFCYDANGNTTAIQASGVTLGSMDWTSFNQPSYIASGTTSGYLYYDGNHQRYKQAATYAGSPETTVYAGGLLEKVSNSSGTTYRHYIPGGNNLIVYNRASTGTNLTYYITKDHLGSSAAITDQTGALVVKEMFGAWGYNENTPAQQATVATISRHEYTGQEQIDNTGVLLTNMNGRIYSPVGSLFLSPDPYMQEPGNTQNFDRYSYVNNNPLSYIDPTGFDETGLPELIVTAGGGPENPYTDVLAGAVEILSDLGLGGLFGGAGGGPTLTPAQLSAQAHGIDLSSSLQSSPGLQTVGNGSLSFATEDGTSTVPDVVVTASRSYGVAQQFYSPFTVSAIASTAGVDPDQVRDLRVTTTPSQSPDELDQVNVYARISGGFNWWNLVPGWSAFVCAYYGCGAGNWTMAAIGAIPFGTAESAVARGGLASVRVGQAGEAAVRAAYDIGDATRITLSNGATRIPDGLLSDALSEVKNVNYLSYTQQLRDFTQYASENTLRFDLFVRPTTILSGPLQEAISSGSINLLFIPGL